MKRDQDLKKEIEEFVKENNISGVILSGVGYLKHLKIRLADGESCLESDGSFEIVSLMGLYLYFL